MKLRQYRLLWRGSLIAASSSLLVALMVAPVHAAQITVSVDQPGARINPAMWGVFFEDINFGADGGLYAELVKNRSFEFPEALMGWRQSANDGAGSLATRDEDPFNAKNPHYLRITSASDAGFGVSNEGFRGMGVREGDSYNFSAQARVASGERLAIRVELVGADGRKLGSKKLAGFTSQWKKHTAVLRVNATDPKAKLIVVVDGRGSLDLDMVSLFPQKTWKNRPGGLRADMVQLLADMKPGFLRFPGGCIVEGSDLDKRYQWKTTLGPVEERKLIINRWNYEFRHRQTPDYYQSLGLGFFEFFLLSEDIGAEPLPILNCGMACQFNTGQLVPLAELDPYIQDALDLIEFANGPVTTVWGAKRAAMGHPAPFKMKLLGIGNEQWGPQYIERYAAFAKALKEKHPEITLISAAGPAPSDERFDFLWPELRRLKADIVDEHCYANPNWFFSSSSRYDHYDRNGPKVFMGEYAAQSDKIVSVENRNNLECALSEAAFMTGLERNADVVRMSSYAPLFAHEDAWQWRPNLIWCDNLRSYGTPNYYVQQLFSLHRGDVVLPVKLDDTRPAAPAAGRIGIGTYNSSAEFKDVRVTRGSETLFSDDFAASPASKWMNIGGNWSVQDGALRQTNARASATSHAGDASWSDYTLTLKARKLGGAEGFIIVVRNSSANTQVQWNLGGWGNTKHGIQELLGVQPRIVAQVPGSIEANRWYDIKVELRGARLNCYLDGQLVQTADVSAPVSSGIFAAAVLDEKRREIVLKVVNAQAQAAEIGINLSGARVTSRAKAVVLAGAKLTDENSYDAPRNVFPVEERVQNAGPSFRHTFRPYSVTVLRVPAETAK